MPAQLLSMSDGPSLLLDKSIVLVGRHEECDIQLNSRKVSRKHCVLAQVGEMLVVRDLGSTNGVRINGVRVEDGALRTGDELTIGNFHYKVHVDQRREAKSPPEPVAGKPRDLPAPVLLNEDDLLEAAEEPVPLPEPVLGPGTGGRQAGSARQSDSYSMPDDIRIKPESSPRLP